MSQEFPQLGKLSSLTDERFIRDELHREGLCVFPFSCMESFYACHRRGHGVLRNATIRLQGGPYGRLGSSAGKVTAGPAVSNGSLPPGVWLKVTSGLTACTSGSASCPTFGNEYGRTLPFYDPSVCPSVCLSVCPIPIVQQRRILWLL